MSENDKRNGLSEDGISQKAERRTREGVQKEDHSAGAASDIADGVKRFRAKRYYGLVMVLAVVFLTAIFFLILLFSLKGKAEEEKAVEEAKVAEEQAETVAIEEAKEVEEYGVTSDDLDVLVEMGGIEAVEPFKYVPREFDTDSNGNLIIPEQQPGRHQEAPEFTKSYIVTGDEVYDKATVLAEMYDYDAAIKLLKGSDRYEKSEAYQNAVKDYKKKKKKLVQWEDNTQITHIFFHTLIVDTSLAFGPTSSKPDAYNEVMTSIDEFVAVISEMYSRGYVMVDIHDIADYEKDEEGNEKMVFKPIMLPEGKIPFVLSQDDVSYYEYMTGDGYATKLLIDDDGKITNEYIMPDGTKVYGAYDMVTIIDKFVEAHPDFSYRGAKGIVALTGYEGILGYRSNEGDEAVKAEATRVADAMKAEGWTFASHSWGHRDMGEISLDHFRTDVDRWNTEVAPLIGGTDVMIYPKGADIHDWTFYPVDNSRFQIFKEYGFNYFCNVDSAQYWVQLSPRGDYMRMGRRNVDGTRLWQAISYYADPSAYSWSEEKKHARTMDDIIDARSVFDWARIMPVK